MVIFLCFSYVLACLISLLLFQVFSMGFHGSSAFLGPPNDAHFLFPSTEPRIMFPDCVHNMLLRPQKLAPKESLGLKTGEFGLKNSRGSKISDIKSSNNFIRLPIRTKRNIAKWKARYFIQNRGSRRLI